MPLNKQQIEDAYNSIYSTDNNNVLKKYVDLTKEEIEEALLVLLNNKSDSSSGNGGTSSGATATEIKTAIETATNLDEVETSLNILQSNTQGLSAYLQSLDNKIFGDIASSTNQSITIAQTSSISSSLGTDITGTTIPTGGIGIRGLLSWIAKLISDRTNTLGVKTAAQSIPVTLSSDGAFSTNFGATTDAVATTDTGNFSFLSYIKRLLSVKLPSALINGRFQTQTVLDSTTVTGSANTTDGLAIPSTDCSNYSFLSLQTTGTWSGILIFEFSNDNINWVSGILYGMNTIAPPNTVTALNSIFYGNKQGRYFRVRFSSYSSGTVNATLSLSSSPSSPAYPVTTISGTPSVNLSTVNNLTPDIATQATLSALNNKLNITSGRLLIDGAGVTQPVSAISLPLAPLAATSTLQTSGNTSLNNVDTKTPALGQALSSGSTPVVLPATQIIALTPPTTITANLGTIAGTATESTLSALNNKLPPTLVNNRLPINTVGASLDLTGTASANNTSIINSTDITDYSWLTFQVTGTWSGSIQVEFSNNNIVWTQGYLYGINTGITVPSITINGIYNVSKQGKYFRISTFNYVSGTVNVACTISNNASVTPPVQMVTFNGIQPVTMSLPTNAATAALQTSILNRLMPAGSNVNLYRSPGTPISINIKSSPGNVYSIIAINTASSIRFLHLFDSIGLPANNASPVFPFPIPPNNGFLVIGQDILGGEGIRFFTGISCGISSTSFTYTAASTTGEVFLLISYL